MHQGADPSAMESRAKNIWTGEDTISMFRQSYVVRMFAWYGRHNTFSPEFEAHIKL